MPYLRMICLGFLVALTAGCESTRWNWLKREPTNDVVAKGGANPTTKGLVDYLNNNASRVRTLKVDDLDVDANFENQPINLRGRILAEKPRSFRMKVSLIGKEEVDIGSNVNEFWFWAAKNPDRYQYFCSYKDLGEGKVKSMPLPIQPEWVMETLGLGPYGPAEKYTLEQDGPNSPTFRLVEKAKSPTGYPVRKVIVINRKEMRSPQPQVTAFLLLDDSNGAEICSAHISSTQQDKATGAVLPYRMELRMPKQKMTMALKLDGVAVNGKIVDTAFARPQMVGVQSVNLATLTLQPAGGFK